MQEYVTLITRTKGPASSYTMDNLKSRLAAAEQRAKDSEAMMIQAAEYGKDLLEKNMALELLRWILGRNVILRNLIKRRRANTRPRSIRKQLSPRMNPSSLATVSPKEENVSSKKIRYSSGESIDSNMSESPMETIQLYQDTDFGDDDDMKTEESCDEELQLVQQPPRYKRAISEELDNKPKRGILKKQAFSLHGAGGRFRCYSESNMEDIGLAASEEKLSFALYEATIAEDEAYSFSNSQKKSVSFNEKVQQQYYRCAI